MTLLSSRLLIVNNTPSSRQTWYTTAEVASVCGVDRRTVLRWAKSGRLPSRMTPGGHHRIAGADVERLINGPRPTRKPPADRELRFLLVDDDRNHSSALARRLRRLTVDARIDTAPDGFLGGVLAERLRPDALFLDLVMPGLDGLSVARRLREDPELAGVGIVLVTAYADLPTEGELAGLGIAGVLPKPVRGEELESVLDDLLGPRLRGARRA